jgi:hypothetical protein
MKCYTNGMSRYTFQCRQCGRELSASRRDAKRRSSSCRVYAFRNIPHHGTFGVADRSQLEVSRPIKSSMTSPNFIEASPSEILKMNMEEAREYCDPKDAAMGKMNGSVQALPVAEVAPILCEPTKPPDGSPPSVMNDYYAAKRRWNEQPRSSIGETNG